MSRVVVLGELFGKARRLARQSVVRVLALGKLFAMAPRLACQRPSESCSAWAWRVAYRG